MRWSRPAKAGQSGLSGLLDVAFSIGDSLAGVADSLVGAVEQIGGLGPAPAPRGIQEIEQFGSNPGNLRMHVYVPASLRPGAPLILLLHGCGQDTLRQATDGGWTAIADEVGGAIVLPEQAPSNNTGRCFNWFKPRDVSRDQGEALSIRQMVAEAVRRFRPDRRRIFIAGLSAGGAMAASLLAAYPEVFAGGAVIAGMPVGTACGLAEALSRMSQAAPGSRREDLVRAAREAAPPGFAGPWPRLSVWQGDADSTIDPANARLLAAQWAGLHGLAERPARSEVAPGVTRARWDDAVELWTLAGMGHGTPVDAARRDGSRSGFWTLDVGLPAAQHIARFWRVLPAA